MEAGRRENLDDKLKKAAKGRCGIQRKYIVNSGIEVKQLKAVDSLSSD